WFKKATPPALKYIAVASSAWATNALAIPLALAPCSGMAKPAPKAGPATKAPTPQTTTTARALPAITAARLRIPWILLWLSATVGPRPPVPGGRGADLNWTESFLSATLVARAQGVNVPTAGLE